MPRSPSPRKMPVAYGRNPATPLDGATLGGRAARPPSLFHRRVDVAVPRKCEWRRLRNPAFNADDYSVLAYLSAAFKEGAKEISIGSKYLAAPKKYHIVIRWGNRAMS